MPRPRQQPRQDEALAERLIDAAEVAYATHGIGGASLRQISAAAGTANHYAVQYHFGDADGLIRAVLEKRMPEIELQRATLLAKAKASGSLRDLRVLNDVLYRPLIEHTNARGERWFGRFVLALFSSVDGLEHGRDSEQLAPVSEHILDLQTAVLPGVPTALLRERHRLLVMMILMSVFHRLGSQHNQHDAALIDHALDMATAALSAPVSKSVRTMLKKHPSLR
jgi:AcrR family transcriptional regulator